jgi:predicted amidophosphoribosyltransferase
VPTVRELSAPYEAFMLGPRRGLGVCDTCFNLTDGYDECFACSRLPSILDAVVPISYSVAREQLHHALASYKRLDGDVARRLGLQLAAVLWQHLVAHEACIARAAGADKFELVATIPSGDRLRDDSHPLHWIVSEAIGPTRDRYARLLRRSATHVEHRAFDAAKFEAAQRLGGHSVLLIDDTWTSGANAQSAAAALKSAGAGPVAALVIGRHVNREWRDNDRRLEALPVPFDWSTCALCAAGLPLSGASRLGDGVGGTSAPRLTVAEEHDLGVSRFDRVE